MNEGLIQCNLFLSSPFQHLPQQKIMIQEISQSKWILERCNGPIAYYAPGFGLLQSRQCRSFGMMEKMEIVFADSGCDGTMAGTAAQALVTLELLQ